MVKRKRGREEKKRKRGDDSPRHSESRGGEEDLPNFEGE